MLLPDANHPITVTRNPKKVRVLFAGQTIADSADVLRLQEADYPAVLYIPRADVRMENFVPSTHLSRCPYKGQASYFTLKAGERESQNAVWTYEKPFPAVQEIAGYLAFYRSRVDLIEEF